MNNDQIIELESMKLSSSIRIGTNEVTSFDIMRNPSVKLFFEKQIGLIHIIDGETNDEYLVGLPNMVYGRVKKNGGRETSTNRNSCENTEKIGESADTRPKVSKANKRSPR